MTGRLAEWRGASLAARSALLTLVVLGLYVLVAGIAWSLSGATGVAAAALAAACCWLGAAAALIVGGIAQQQGHILLALLLGIFLRVGIPLAVAAVFHFRGGSLAEAGLLYYFLVFYPLTLTVETTLSLPPVSR